MSGGGETTAKRNVKAMGKKAEKKSSKKSGGGSGKAAPLKLPPLNQLLATIEAVCNDSKAWTADPLRCLTALLSLLDRLVESQHAAEELASGGASMSGGSSAGTGGDNGHGNRADAEAIDRFWGWVTATAGPGLRDSVAIGWAGEGVGNGLTARRNFGELPAGAPLRYRPRLAPRWLTRLLLLLYLRGSLRLSAALPASWLRRPLVAPCRSPAALSVFTPQRRARW